MPIVVCDEFVVKDRESRPSPGAACDQMNSVSDPHQQITMRWEQHVTIDDGSDAMTYVSGSVVYVAWSLCNAANFVCRMLAIRAVPAASIVSHRIGKVTKSKTAVC